MPPTILKPIKLPRNDLTGQRFGKLLVLSLAGRNSRSEALWNCLCDCGQITVSHGGSLKRGRTISCGCAKRERIIKRNFRHGAIDTTTHWIWQGMKQRCFNPNHIGYFRYGGRGITVCQKWLDFNGFVADVGLRPSKKHSLDRYPNPNGNYEPGNVRWATATEQGRNRTDNVYYEFEGKKKTMPEWAEFRGIRLGLIYSRLARGLSIEDALSTTRFHRSHPAPSAKR